MSEPLLRNLQRKHPLPMDRLQAFANRLMERFRLSNATFTVVMTSDLRITALNWKFRHVNKPTDVLSFPAQPSPREPELEERELGDIVISVETACRQAIAQGHSLDTEIGILMIHGLLHLLGYDHEGDHGEMRRKELRLRGELL